MEIIAAVPVDRERSPTIDYLKAAAIVAVVLTHAGPPATLPDTAAWERMLRVTLVTFHVPTFLAISGFLYRGSGLRTIPSLKLRLSRVLLPYLVATVAAYACGLAALPDGGEALYRLVTASALGIYYFVFALAVSILSTFVLIRLSPRLPAAALGGLVVLWVYRAIFVAPPEPRILPEFWAARDITRFYVYFLGGWVARDHWPAIRRLVDQHRQLLLAACATGVILHVVAWEFLRVTNLVVLARAVYTGSVVGLFALCGGGEGDREPPRAIRALSDLSYTIYLYHLFFILPLAPLLADTIAPIRLLLLTVAGLGGSLALAWLVNQLLGARARQWFGA